MLMTIVVHVHATTTCTNQEHLPIVHAGIDMSLYALLGTQIKRWKGYSYRLSNAPLWLSLNQF